MGNTSILKRNNIYYFRIKIPVDVFSYINRKEIWKSLQTNNLKLARTSAKSINYHLEKLFTWIRSGMLTDEQIKHIIKEHLNRTLKGHEVIRNMGILSYVPKGAELPGNKDDWQKASISTLQQSIEQYSMTLADLEQDRRGGVSDPERLDDHLVSFLPLDLGQSIQILNNSLLILFSSSVTFNWNLE